MYDPDDWGDLVEVLVIIGSAILFVALFIIGEGLLNA